MKVPEQNIFIDRVREIWKSGIRSIYTAKDKAAKDFGFNSYAELRKNVKWKILKRDQR